MGLNLVKQQDDDDNYSIIDKIHLHVKDPYEAKYQYPIKNREKKNGIATLNDPKAFFLLNVQRVQPKQNM